MPQPRPDSLDDAFPSALRTAEAAQIHTRRSHVDCAEDAPLVGVALSGGGIRSATFCIGVFQGLARHKLVRQIDYLSTVSGGGYFGGFLGAAFTRDGNDAEKIEQELCDNHSWPIQWLRDNGRFLSPNGAGDSWTAAAVMLRNWVALQLVMITFAFLLFGAGVLFRTELSTALSASDLWMSFERFMWSHRILGLWWSPWLVLPVIPFATLMVPGGVLFWLTQCTPLMNALRKTGVVFSAKVATYSEREFVSIAQNKLTRLLVIGFVPTVVLLVFALVDTLGQTAYWKWSANNFQFPTMWTLLTGAGFGAYGFASKIYILIEGLLGKGKLKFTFDSVALMAALTWALLIIIGVSVAACALAWSRQKVAISGALQLQADPQALAWAVAIALALSWVFSRSFSFVNLSSLQQVYAARLRRAYIGATNQHRQAAENYSMTELIAGDDLCVEEYRPQANGGPLHLINVTVNETLSAKTQIERRDRKGLAMSVGPCGISVGTSSHALWADHITKPKPRGRALVDALFEDPKRPVVSIDHDNHALLPARETGAQEGAPLTPHFVEALSVGRWVAISGAAFTTGLGAGTNLGMSLLLGLANVRLGYWWDSGIAPGKRHSTTPLTVMELCGRFANWLLPLQTCLVNELFARFHGPSRRYWYLSDGGHFENLACYELIRRRIPFIICTDCGMDDAYEFGDLANLVRKARIDFGAEIEVIRRSEQADKKEPGHDLPSLEQIVHPSLLGIFGSPEDFQPLDTEGKAHEPVNRRHALLARIRYSDTQETCWLLLIKPSLGGDEPVDVIQYQRTHPAFPQEPTSDQYFDEAQWESYRKLGQHIASTLFTPVDDDDPRWSPARFSPPSFAFTTEPAPVVPAAQTPEPAPAFTDAPGQRSRLHFPESPPTREDNRKRSAPAGNSAP